MGPRLGVLMGACWLLVAGQAAATDAGSQAASAPTQPSPEVDTASRGADEAGAERPGAEAYREALTLYEAGDVGAALQRMQESHRVSGRAELLYNVARLQAELGDCSAALQSYQQYLEQAPGGRYREAARAAVADLTSRCREVEPPTEAAASLPARPRDTATAAHERAPVRSPPDSRRTAGGSRTARWLGWSALAAGALAGAGATYFTFAAVDARQRFRASVAQQESGGPLADLALRDEQHRAQHWAQGLFVAGGVLATSGLVLVLTAPGAPAGATFAELRLRPDLVTASLSRAF